MNSILTQEFCVRHPRKVYRMYCEHCQVPLCDSCSEDNSHTFKSCFFGKGQHTILDIQGAYETKRQQSKLTINTIKSEAFFFGICSHARNQSWYQNMSYGNIPLSTTYVKKVPENEEYNWLYANRFYVQCVLYQWYQTQMVRTKEKVGQTYSPSSEIYTHIWTVRKKSAPIPFIH